MPKYSLTQLGAMVKNRRGSRKLRETATEIEISAPTLLRIESGRMPDIDTFGKICRWLRVDPGDFLGRPDNQSQAPASTSATLWAHFKADKASEPETLNALARMLLLVMQHQPGVERES
jgi:transcriptional regulator with XRE-family HTH domain